jgi:uncharacterized protein DUF4157
MSLARRAAENASPVATVHSSRSAAWVQRQCSCHSDTGLGTACRAASAPLHQQHVASVVNYALQSGGRPLESDRRAFFEERFGHDFSAVRVHTDTRAADSAHALSASAYTVGHNIVFGRGRYEPAAVAGKRLLAHELAHVVQQSRGGSPPAPGSSAGELERQADSAALDLAPTTRKHIRGATVPGIQKNAEAYVWDPHVDAFGHASLKLCDGTYISWWPADDGTTKQQLWTGRPGEPHDFATDIGPEPTGEGKGPDATYDLGCNCLDEEAIKRWYRKNFSRARDPKWAVLRNSCSDIAHQALNEGSSLANPCYLSLSHSNLFWTPKDFGNYASCQSRWCKSKEAGALAATGRYIWEQVKEIAGGAALNTLRSLWWKGEILAHAMKKHDDRRTTGGEAP